MAHSLSTSWGRKGRKGCTGQVLLAAVAAVAGSILSAPRSFGTFDHLWRDLIASPQNWEDFRVDKPGGNPKFPDFKRTGDKESLWLNSAPDWVQSKLPEIETKLAPGRRGKARSTSSKEHLWQDLFDSPQDWEDFRVDKPRGNPKFPDFKQRMGDKESLWLNAAPDWVHSKLEETEQTGNAWKQPRSRATFGEGSQPSEPEVLPKLTDPVEITQRWEELMSTDPEQDGWMDYREAKESGSYSPDHPDFLKPHTGEGLWCDETMPGWAKEKLKEFCDP
eukprot:symbB.v1.2.025011.t1/scaffold2406.1/size85596/8